METLRAFTDVTQPDPRNLHFVKFDASAPDGLSPITLEDIHRAMADPELGTNVPEGIAANSQSLATFGYTAGCVAVPFRRRIRGPLDLQGLSLESVGCGEIFGTRH